MIVYELKLEDSVTDFENLLFASLEAARAAVPDLLREYVEQDGEEHAAEEYPVMGEWEEWMGLSGDGLVAYSTSGPGIRATIIEREVRA